MLPVFPNNYSFNAQGIPVYNFQDPNSVDFQYTFNAAQNNVNGSVTRPDGKITGIGFWGSQNIASPLYACHPVNKNNAFSDSFPNWLSTINGQIDLRAFYVECRGSVGNYSFSRLIPDQNEVLSTLSSYTGSPVAYTTEALYYAQSGYFVTVVMVQWSNVFACKSRKVIFYFILVLINLLRCQQTHVRWYCLRNRLVHHTLVRSRHQWSLWW